LLTATIIHLLIVHYTNIPLLLSGSLTQASALHTNYTSQNLDFGISLSSFTSILSSSVPEGAAASTRLMNTFDCEAQGVVDVLEVLCGLAVAGHASLPEKAEFCFEVFDFNGTKTLTYDEAFILLFTVLRAAVRLAGKGVEPEDSDVEKMVDEIYLRSDKEPTASLTLEDIKDWLLSEVNMGVKKGEKKHVSLYEFMMKFDVLDEEDARELEEASRLMSASKPTPNKKKHHHHHHKEGRASPTN